MWCICFSIFENVEVEDNAPSIPSARLTVFTPIENKAEEGEIAPHLHFIIFPEKMIECQKGDTSLRQCFATVISTEEAQTRETVYFMEAGVLMQKWPAHDTVSDWSEVCQVVVPIPFRQQVLSLAHDQAWSGHLGITNL
jgi:hypothetical protein